MDINLKFEGGGKKLETGSNKPFRLIRLEGLETGEFELFTTSNVSSDGSRVNNKKIVSKPILAEIKHVGENSVRLRNQISSLLNVHNNGKLTVKINDNVKAIDYVVESFKFDSININSPLKFMVSLFCPDPYFRSPNETKKEIAIWQSAFEFPLDIEQEGIRMGFREPSLIVNVFNGGDVETGMRIKFKALGTLTNPSLFNVNTREYFKINTTMEAGDVITVNTNTFHKRVELERNGIVTNYFNWIDLHSTFLQLEPKDNLFRYDADDGLDNLEVDIYYNPKNFGGVSIELYIFNEKLERKGIAEGWTSVRWVRRYSKSGEFEIHFDFVEGMQDLLQEDDIIWKNDSHEAGYIDHINIRVNEDGNEVYIIKGKFLTSYLDRRIIWGRENIHDTPEAIARKLINDNLINPINLDRKIELFKLDNVSNIGSDIHYQASFKNVLEAVEEIATVHSLGIRTKLDLSNKEILFGMYEGVNRTVDQTINPPAIFSQEFDNILEQEYVAAINDYKTAALIAGEGEGVDRQLTEIGGGEGLSRYELYVDARDLQSTKRVNDEEVPIPLAEYNSILKTRGISKLAETTRVESFDSKVDLQSNLEYRKDYDLGDIVTCLSQRWGLAINERITEIEEVYEEDGFNIFVVFGNEEKNVVQKIKKRGEAVNIRSGFFNSINGDRKYDAGFFAEYFATFIGNGVFPNPSRNLQVVANNDMSITVQPGSAWINGYVALNDDGYVFKLEPADGILSRIDRVILRWDLANREIKIVVKRGEFAANPVAKELQRDADAYELGLADIRISKGTISITQANITDLRLNDELCGIVHGVVDQVDTSTLFAQYTSWYEQTTEKADADIEDIKFNFIRDWNNWYSDNTTNWEVEFGSWFDSMKGLLDEDIGATLANQIIEINNTIEELRKGVTQFRVGNVEGFKASAKSQLKIELSLGDPKDSIVIDENGDEVTLAKWDGSMVRGKLNSYPIDENDGTLIFDNKTRDKYKNEPFVFDFLNDGEEWHFMAFPYTEKGVYTVDSANRDKATATIKLDQSAPSAPVVSDIEFDRATVLGGDLVSLDKMNWFPSPHIFTGLTEETSYIAYAKLVETDIYLESPISEGRTFITEMEADPSSWAGIQKIVRKGIASEFFTVGDQVMSNYDGGEIIWEVIGIDVDTPVDSQFQHSMTIQTRDCLHDIQFDATEPNNPDSNRKSNGNNRYTHSAIRQWLNSNEATFIWQSQHQYDAKPTANPELYDGAGFLDRLDPELVGVLGEVNKKVALNTATDGGGHEEFANKVFLISPKEAGYTPAEMTVDGDYAGESVYPFYDGKGNANRIKNLNNTARLWWLRSPAVSSSSSVRIVYSDGSLHDRTASYSSGLSPACTIV